MEFVYEPRLEWMRFSGVNARLWQRALSSSISMTFWLAAAILAISWYGLVKVKLSEMFWPFLAFLLYSEPLWAAADARSHLRAGVAEQILAARSGLASTLFVWLLADSAIWSAVDAAVLYTIFAAVFGETPSAAWPTLLPAALALLYAPSLSTAVMSVRLFLATQNPALTAIVLQLAVPLAGGVIPPAALPKTAAELLLYIIGPTVYADSGGWHLPPQMELGIGAVVAFALLALSLALDRTSLKGLK